MNNEVGTRYRVCLALMVAVASLLFIYNMMTAPVNSPHEGNGWLLLAYVILLLFTWLFPVRLGELSINVSLGIIVPLYLQFGVVPTVIVVNLAWFLSHLISNRHLRSHRLVANLSMMSLMTMFSDLGFRLAAGFSPPISWDVSPFSYATPVIVFMCVHFLTNYLIMFILEAIRSGGKIGAWSMGVLWDLTALGIESLIVILLVSLQHMLGPIALLYTALPYIALIYIFRLYSNLVIANRQLSLISDATIKLNKDLNEEEMLDTLLQGVMDLVVASASYVFAPRDDGYLTPIAVRGASAEIEDQMRNVTYFGADPKRLPDMSHWLRNTADASLVYQEPVHPSLRANSVLSVPIQHDECMLGMLVVTHSERIHYSTRDREMLQIIANQAAIGWLNAQRLKRSEQQTVVDELTGLFNYRYFESMLPVLCRRADEMGEPLTLLVLDLDRFKAINDEYGHIPGNEVLKAVAQIIREQVRDGDVVCRYGGEEFTVILPGANYEVSMHIAERLRQSIASTKILIPPQGNTLMFPLSVTVSIGAATYPDTADVPQSLLRNADRAMYVGSKQRGRNRVAFYGMYDAL